eukprot:CAMPEP_0185589358 /NCGR_PEP_ID=MMETSP0434-20130131/56744_1 /TAXON_ID=626734 ORGANISM="Favella taraikaensis, Strain Fe Narragansett Bay" /NCGR_SAMPLE_ID=MMETSP0434 /ASSEMBLY_ACC=CAM_ASM_000379 /LENGTH=139 /DNA_ID=CAMNT_0028212699 /DNA_START=234 /DNA_END=653 /DNA_ORIENTATION=+
MFDISIALVFFKGRDRNDLRDIERLDFICVAEGDVVTGTDLGVRLSRHRHAVGGRRLLVLELLLGLGQGLGKGLGQVLVLKVVELVLLVLPGGRLAQRLGADRALSDCLLYSFECFEVLGRVILRFVVGDGRLLKRMLL